MRYGLFEFYFQAFIREADRCVVTRLRTYDIGRYEIRGNGKEMAKQLSNGIVLPAKRGARTERDMHLRYAHCLNTTNVTGVATATGTTR